MSELERIRRLYAAAGDPGPHPDEATWERLACGVLVPEERRQVVDHIGACAECARIFRVLVDVHEGAVDFDSGLPRPGPGAALGSKRGRNLAIGSALLAAGIAAVWLVVPRSPPTEGPGSAPVVRSVEEGRPRPIAPLGRLEAPPPSFTWKAAEGAFTVELLDGEGELLWSGPQVEEGRADWPESVPLRPGTYYWRVVPDTGRPSDLPSPMVTFELAVTPE